MIYRLDELNENRINPITNYKYDNSWMILALTDSRDYKQMCGRNFGCAYTIKVSRLTQKNWEISVGDFISFCKANNKNAILVMSETDLNIAKEHYGCHKYNDAFLREEEPPIFVHSTSLESLEQIQRDKMLKSWNILKKSGTIPEEKPIGTRLGDPVDFSDYIMFGSGITGEIIVNSKQRGKIIMEENAEYLTGARLYFDAKKIAEDGLLVRDGCHLKVKDTLPLIPYFIWAATWDTIGLTSRTSTPKFFAEQAEKEFKIFMEKQSGSKL